MFERRKALRWLPLYLRYTNYLGAAQLYLKQNCLLRRELMQEDIKERILGHWGTVPGLNFLYAHLNFLISRHSDREFMFIVGPGHGAPAVIANLFAEGSLREFYPELTLDENGTSRLVKMFSWPGGFPSHTNPGTPGAILEGGELGYSLSTAYGAVFDNPSLVAVCVVGDGEAESGPLSASWHSNKYLDPARSGAVLPILHVNGYKITGPTIYGVMNDEELRAYFSGLGYEPFIVDCTGGTGEKEHIVMMKTLEKCYERIRDIQKKARKRVKKHVDPLLRPRWPMIVYRSIKGETGIAELHGHKVAGLYRSHGIPASEPKKNMEEFAKVKAWLASYRFTELVDERGRPRDEVMRFVPKGLARMGMNRHTYGGKVRRSLRLPQIKKYETKVSKTYADAQIGSTGIAAKYLRDVIRLNSRAKNFRFMCPDETESNKFQALFEATNRAFVWPVHSYDEHLAPDGRVMEILSEHTLQGWLQGYLLTGRHGIFATYEAFAGIVSSMVDQYAKFLKQSMHVAWRKPVSSLNYLLTSVGWRQEHNGYSHQNPSFISGVLEKHGKFCSVYLPADANSLLVVLEDCLKRTNSINVIVAGKQPMPQWLTLAEARAELKRGVGRWDFVDRQGATSPDVILAASGDVPVMESLAAIWYLKKMIPELQLRFVNVSEITALGIGDERHPLALDNREFEHFFGDTTPVVFNFHGYPGAIQRLIYGHEATKRFKICGYMEEGTTTTPFDMVVRNGVSRFHLAMKVLDQACPVRPDLTKKIRSLNNYFEQLLKQHARYIVAYGKDMPEVTGWRWEDV